MSHPVSIDGTTRLFVIVGDPIVHVKSPAVYTQLFADRGIPAVLVPMHVLPQDMEAVGRQLQAIRNLDGILVTAPYKASMLGLCSSLGPAADCVGAINAMRRDPRGGWHGDLFDGAGFVIGAKRQGLEIAGRHVLLFGAGGAGSAIVYELARAGVASLELMDPDSAKIERLRIALRRQFPTLDISEVEHPSTRIDFIINASTVGVGGSPGVPGPLPPLTPAMSVGEVNITAQGTELIRLARSAGVPWVDGSFMHSGQIDCLFDFFFPGHVER